MKLITAFLLEQITKNTTSRNQHVRISKKKKTYKTFNSRGDDKNKNKKEKAQNTQEEKR